jgi:hypothetical protein
MIKNEQIKSNIREFTKKPIPKFVGLSIGVLGSLYLAVNAAKPTISRGILEWAFENNYVTKMIENDKPGYPNNTNKLTTLTTHLESYTKNTYLASNGETIKYTEDIGDSIDSFGGKGKVLFIFVGIDNHFPNINSESFEKYVFIYYDPKNMSREKLAAKGAAVSEMIKRNYSKYDLSLFSTSFGSLSSSFLDGDLKFENRVAFAPFVGESELVKEVTGLPLPVSFIHGDQYNNFIKNPDRNTKIYIGDKDGLTGGLSLLRKMFPNTTVLPNINHSGYEVDKDTEITVEIKIPVNSEFNSLTPKQQKETKRYYEILN